MAEITFTDAIGAATLRNAYGAPADRFANWTPITRPVGDSAVAQGTGARSMFRFRDDYMASFELRGISSHATSGVAPIDVADRLIYHLLNGGTCSVATEDADANTYATCGLAPGADPQLQLADPQNLEYTLTLTLINLAAVPARMVCRYDGST